MLELLLAAGIALCFICSQYAASTTNKITAYLNTTGSYQYQTYYGVGNADWTVNATEFDVGIKSSENDTFLSLSAINQALTDYPCDASIRLSLYPGKSMSEQFASVWFCPPKHQGAFLYEYTCSDPARYSGSVYVGENLMPYVESSGTDHTIDISGKTFAVLGIYKDSIVSEQGDLVNILYDSLNEEGEKALNPALNDISYPPLMLFCSDQKKINPDDLAPFLESAHLQHIPSSYETNDFSGEMVVTYGSLTAEIMVVIFGFVFANLLIISDLWYKTRFRELTIRKICGAEWYHIVLLCLKDLLRVSGLALIGIIPFDLVMFLTHRLMWDDLKNIPLSLGIIAGGLLLAFLFAIFTMVTNYNKISLAGALNE